MQGLRSTCCGFPVYTQGGETLYYICSSCGQPCEARNMEIEHPVRDILRQQAIDDLIRLERTKE